MKTSNLIGPELDWAVATSLGFRVEKEHPYTDEVTFNGWWQCGPNHWQPLCRYSTDWAQGGPIIERESLDISAPLRDTEEWHCCSMTAGIRTLGETPLIAAMRCYVASVLGDEIELPNFD